MKTKQTRLLCLWHASDCKQRRVNHVKSSIREIKEAKEFRDITHKKYTHIFQVVNQVFLYTNTI